MTPYQPQYISGMQTGLVQSRENFIIPQDAYPVLENAYVWRERIKRRQGYELLGRLRRDLPAVSWFNSSPSIWSFTLLVDRGFIIAANNANPGQVTTESAHGLTTNDQVVISGVVGATGYNARFTITVVDAFNFTVGANAAGFGAYVSGGTFISNRSLNEPNATLVPGTVIFTIGGITFTDQGNGTLTSVTIGNSADINYITGVIEITHTAGSGVSTTVALSYYPGLPVMGLRKKELDDINSELTIAFDTKYAYQFIGTAWQEYIPGTTWTGNDSDFFWSTNYWISNINVKIFWVTNDSGVGGDPIRYTDGRAWIDFSPIIDAGGNKLTQCLCMLPFRGRMMVFNTLEGLSLGASINYRQRIRWSAIGNPFSDVSTLVTAVNPKAWLDDVRGQGGFLDIPTSQDIISVGFVRDNLVIYCEQSTWQLRYTGRSIAPFQIEKVNSELGAESTFSAVQFDTSLVGVGDKGIVECDSFKSDRIDVKIPDLVFKFNNLNNGTKRVHGIRDFVSKLAYWIYPFSDTNGIYPDRRLVYNYDNDSWAIFTDSLTALGTFQPPTNRTWGNTHKRWRECNFSWANRPALIPDIIGGNQQGFVEYIGESLDGGQTSNDSSLFIYAISNNTPNAVRITSHNHNMQTGYVISVSDIPALTPFATALNDMVFGIVVDTINTFLLYTYNDSSQLFDIPFTSVETGYIGGGLIEVRDNFSVVSKKFNFAEQGQNIQIGYLDILMPTTDSGAITLNMYQNYDDNEPTNTLPQNNIEGNDDPDTFFNSVIPTNASDLGLTNSTKTWQRVFCATRAQFLTLEYTLSNAQMNGFEQENRVEIDAQVIWSRPGGRMSI